MSKHLDPLDHAFDSLRSRGAALDGSFSRKLEDRLMQELQKPRSRFRRPLSWLAAGVLVLFAGTGAAGYAATDGFTAWPWNWNVSVGDDGFVKDQDGNVIGISTDHKDGSSTTLIQMGEGHTIIDADQSLKGKGELLLRVEP
jgi:hypothetical protein